MHQNIALHKLGMHNVSIRYSIEKKEKLGTRWVKCGKTSGPDCKYRVTDVIEGTEVQFQIRAENEAGAGHPSEPTEILTVEDPTGVFLRNCLFMNEVYKTTIQSSIHSEAAHLATFVDINGITLFKPQDLPLLPLSFM